MSVTVYGQAVENADRYTVTFTKAMGMAQECVPMAHTMHVCQLIPLLV